MARVMAWFMARVMTGVMAEVIIRVSGMGIDRVRVGVGISYQFHIQHQGTRRI